MAKKEWIVKHKLTHKRSIKTNFHSRQRRVLNRPQYSSNNNITINQLQNPQKQQEYNALNKRILDGFVQLRQKYLYGKQDCAVESSKNESPPRNAKREDKDNLVYSPLSQYEPLANIKLKLFKQNIKKSSTGNKNINNEIEQNQEQFEKYSLFDGSVSKCNYKVVDLSTQSNRNNNYYDEQLSTAVNSIRFKQNSKSNISSNNSKILSNDKKSIDNKISSQIKEPSSIAYNSPQREPPFYHLQPNELSTKMSFYNIQHSDSKREVGSKYNQYSFFQDNLFNQELNSSRSLSSNSQTSFIFSPVKDVDLANIINNGSSKKLQNKIKLNLPRPKSQETNLKNKHIVQNSRQSTPDQSIFKYSSNQTKINRFIYPETSQSLQKYQDQKENIASIKIENQIQQVDQNLPNKHVLNLQKEIAEQGNKEQQQEWKRNGFRQQQNKSQDTFRGIKYARQYDLCKELSKELIKKDQFVNGNNILQFDPINENQINGNELFNKYLASYTTTFIGSKLQKSSSSEKRHDLISRSSNRNIPSQKQKIQFENLQKIQLLDCNNQKEINEKIVEQSNQPVKSLTQRQYFPQRKFSQNKSIEEKNKQSNLDNSQQEQKQQKSIFKRKYSYDNSQKDNNKSFDIHCVNYKPILLNLNKQIYHNTQNYFTSQINKTNSFNKTVDLLITEKAQRNLDKLCEQRFQYQNIEDNDFKFTS